ncbi:MAG: SAM-dependent chlorinase/fluorinase, partial [Kiritimatiellae bacterium]|nr:SAM-dependent chlorinase/fluorinase [Kiritimatiellia bacterium]
SGQAAIEDIAEPVEETLHPNWSVVRRDGELLRGEVVHVDHFGNVITNIPRQSLDETGWPSVIVEAGNSTICGLKGTYGDVAPGEKLALIDSSGLLELACRGRSAADRMILCIGDEVVVRKGA